MTTFLNKIASGVLGLDKQTDRPWLNIILAIFLAATMLSLPGGADAVHCLGGIFLLIGCGVHLLLHRRWIKALILVTPNNLTPALRRRRWLFWGMLISGFVCGLTGVVALPLLFCGTPIHILSGLVFLSLNINHLGQHRNWFTKRISQVSAAVRK
jgi:hypothetical protein